MNCKIQWIFVITLVFEFKCVLHLPIQSLTLDPYEENRIKAANNLESRFNLSTGLLAGAHAGGNGFQWFGYSIIDENYFAAKALMPYNPKLAQLLEGNMKFWLDQSQYNFTDRRENLWGKLTLPITGSNTIVLSGENIKNSPYCVYTEINNNITYTPTNLGSGINHMVPLLLAEYMRGNDKTASTIFHYAYSLWDGIGFREKAAIQAGHFYTRALGYFLFAERALGERPGFSVKKHDIEQMENQLWQTQVCENGTGITAKYSFSGFPLPMGHNCPGHARPDLPSTQLSSIETICLALIIYDERIHSEWFPIAKLN